MELVERPGWTSSQPRTTQWVFCDSRLSNGNVINLKHLHLHLLQPTPTSQHPQLSLVSFIYCSQELHNALIILKIQLQINGMLKKNKQQTCS